MSLDELVASWSYTHASAEQQKRWLWDYGVQIIDDVYHHLVDGAMPSEEARGLLPLATAGPINFKTDMRNLIAHAGNRLCTQAQFHWRDFFTQMVDEIRHSCDGTPNEWQGHAIADSDMFKPVCYQLGHCPFKASFDRGCTIRPRVDAFSRAGVRSSEWNKPHQEVIIEETISTHHEIDAIDDAEWRFDPAAARTTV